MGSSILFSKVGDAADRFPEFATEIQAILRQHGEPVGSSEAISALAASLKRPGHLRDDLVSMVNALCYQEPGTTTLDLVGLLLVAAAGKESTEAIAASPALEEPVRQVFNSLVEARRARQVEDEARLAGGIEDDEEPSEAATFAGAQAPEPLPQPAAPPVASPRGSVLARALAISADEYPEKAEAGAAEAKDTSALPKPVVVSNAGTLVTPPVEHPAHEGSLFATASEVASAARRFPAWAVGVCGVLLGLLMGFFLHQKLASPTPVQAPARLDASLAPVRGTSGGERDRVTGATPQRVSGAGGGAREFEGASRRSKMPEPDSARGDSAVARRNGVAGRPATAASGVVQPQPSSASSSGVSSTSASGPRGLQPPLVRPVDMNAPAGGVAAGRPSVRLPNVVTGASGIMAANLLASPAPAYPVAANAARVQGEVVIEAVVDRDGNVSEARVVSGPLLLRDAALDAVQRWRFRPYEVDGKPTEIGTTARIEFRLNH